jgi:hypothetical protein
VRRPVVERFVCAPTLECIRHQGTLSLLLECDSNELLGTGWRKYSHAGDRPVHRTIEADIALGRGGRYQLRCISKSDDLICLDVQTFVRSGVIHGVSHLQHLASGRTHINLLSPPKLKES